MHSKSDTWKKQWWLVSLTLTWMAPENGWLSPDYSPFGAKGLFSMGEKLFVSGCFRFLWFPLFVGSWTLDMSCCCFMPTIRNGSQTWLWWRCFNNLTAVKLSKTYIDHRPIITARFSKQFQNSTHVEVIFGLCRPQCFFSRSGCRLRASSQLWVVRAFQNTIPILIPVPNSPFGIKWLTINVWWCSMFDDSEYQYVVSVDLKLQNLGKTIVEAATQLLLSLLSEV